MRLFSAGVVFIIAFAVGAVVILTFTQEPFKVPVAAKLLFYEPPAIPVYWYVMGGFFLGLLLGMLIALWVWIGSLSASGGYRKTIRGLEDELAQARVAQPQVAPPRAASPDAAQPTPAQPGAEDIP